jgi:hypothetical protein
MQVSHDYLINLKGEKSMVRQYRKCRELGCRDFGADCDLMVRGETVEEAAKYGYDHGCHVYGKCGISPETVVQGCHYKVSGAAFRGHGTAA